MRSTGSSSSRSSEESDHNKHQSFRLLRTQALKLAITINPPACNHGCGRATMRGGSGTHPERLSCSVAATLSRSGTLGGRAQSSIRNDNTADARMANGQRIGAGLCFRTHVGKCLGRDRVTPGYPQARNSPARCEILWRLGRCLAGRRAWGGGSDLDAFDVLR